MFRKNIIQYTFIAILGTLLSATVYAQKVFIEGVVSYKVKVTPVPNSTGDKAKEHYGTFTITVKGDQVRKEFMLDNGFNNVILYNINTNTAYSLKTLPGRKYAIQLDRKEMDGKNQVYEGYKLTDGAEQASIAGLSTRKAGIAYKDGSNSDILYSKEWKFADEHMYSKLPGINGIPLEYTFITDDGSTMLMHAEKVAVSVVENASFALPKDYTIITRSEYKELTKQ